MLKPPATIRLTTALALGGARLLTEGRTVSVAPISSSRDIERVTRRQQTHKVVLALAQASGQEREELLMNLVAVNMPVARSVASRYRQRGVSAEDLEQVAYLALVRVARRFDPTMGYDFLSYAVPSIRGEVRRYFRDQGWMVRPPRAVQEMQAKISAVDSVLAFRLGHPASPSELALELGEPLSAVEEALAADGCFTPTSLDQELSSGEAVIGDQIGAEDLGLDAAEARMMLAPVLRALSFQERRVLHMRYVGQLTQQEIADAIGVTQAHVSRLLGKLFTRIRSELGSAEPA